MHAPGIAQRNRYDVHNAKAMARAVELRDMGHTQSEIAAQLQQEGFKGMSGGEPSQISVYRLLKRAAEIAAAAPKVLPGLAVVVASNPPAETAIKDPELAEIKRMQEADQQRVDEALRRERERHHMELAPPKAPPIPTGPEFYFGGT